MRTRAHSRVYTPSVMLISITEYVYITPRNHNSLLWPPTLGLCPVFLNPPFLYTYFSLILLFLSFSFIIVPYSSNSDVSFRYLFDVFSINPVDRVEIQTKDDPRFFFHFYPSMLCMLPGTLDRNLQNNRGKISRNIGRGRKQDLRY